MLSTVTLRVTVFQLKLFLLRAENFLIVQMGLQVIWQPSMIDSIEQAQCFVLCALYDQLEPKRHNKFLTPGTPCRRRNEVYCLEVSVHVPIFL